ncbi:VanZ family protein [Phycicoccus duodecadis]|jgi:hypothetical protein|uniref:VanZ like protein n=1 Tax=Phycicoccus duodecadis TaxID=173053 RepID=A0A2N3YJT4_9MICO|nr:VanZ family protein [Phycicoccus duodecadis]PKW27113.1 hypothetical protein ATL31_1948 [Phycicoccus duodecadis]
MTAPTPVARGRRRILLGALVLAVLVQFVVLYAPRAPGVEPFPNADKVVHLLLFLVPTLLGLAAGLAPRAVVGLLAAHAVVSEVVQGALLPHRSSDPLDVLADLTGVALAVLLWWLVRRRRASGAALGRW